MLNRSTQASKIVNDAQRPNAATANQWAGFEKTTAEATQELAEGLEKITGQPFPMLFDAQKDMLAAATDLEGRKFEPCAGHDREALTNLVKARNTVRMVLSKPKPGCSPQEMRNFDRTQAQKLRRPKEKDEKQEAEQLPDRLRELAKQEEFVYATAAKPPEESDQPPESKAKPAKGSATGSASGKPDEKKDPSSVQPRGKQDGQEKASAEPGKEKSSKEPGKSPASDRQEPAQSPSESPGSGGDGGEPKQDLQKLQSEIVEKARAIEQTMSRLAGQKDGRAISELARSRMSTAVKKAEETAGSINRNQRGEAAKTAKAAAGMFLELATHVEGLLGREAAQRLAAARDLAGNLAQRERDLADRLDRDAPPDTKPGTSASTDPVKQESQEKPSDGKSAKGSQKSKSSSQKGKGSSKGESSPDNGDPGIAGQDALDKAARMAESGRTLEDLLKALAPGVEAKNIRPETLDRIEKLLREADAATLIRRMQEVEGMLRAGRVAGSQNEARQIAERLEALSQRLDALHRAVVAPQLESLIALEKRAAELRERLKTLDSPAAISQWHRDADLLLQELGRLKARSAPADRLTEAMRAQGWGTNVTRWDWTRATDYYAVPGVYDASLATIETELRETVREFVLRELVAAGNEPTPPQYKELVERYFQVLSQQGSRTDGRKAPE